MSVRQIVEIIEELCDGCGECVPSCHEGAIRIVDGKARLVADSLCDGLGACLGECPQGAIRIVERKAAPFVMPLAPPPPALAAAPAQGCPGSRMRTLRALPGAPPRPAGPSPMEQKAAASDSALSHWPVKIALVPPTAPFLRGADLLVAADCVPVAVPGFQREFLDGRAVMIGCPKFDDLASHTRRFAELFAQSGVSRVSVVVMEVPCCQSLPEAVRRGRDAAGSTIPIEKVVVGVDGAVIEKTAL